MTQYLLTLSHLGSRSEFLISKKLFWCSLGAPQFAICSNLLQRFGIQILDSTLELIVHIESCRPEFRCWTSDVKLQMLNYAWWSTNWRVWGTFFLPTSLPDLTWQVTWLQLRIPLRISLRLTDVCQALFAHRELLRTSTEPTQNLCANLRSRTFYSGSLGSHR